MGMDVYGKNPKQNRNKNEFPTLVMVDSMDIDDKWELLNKDEKKKKEYWEERDNYENANRGIYFRNNCWWWRPLWNYCYFIADDIISEEIYHSGHNNSGSGLDDKEAKLLGNRLLQQIREGKTIQYQADYQQYLDDLPDENCSRCNNNNHGDSKKKECTSCNKTGKRESWDKSYPFDIDNVKEFAEFCIESGGFEIC